eukprot:scaffold246_cov242-Pinguiococcus_pyrenoidosus.AAC.9
MSESDSESPSLSVRAGGVRIPFSTCTGPLGEHSRTLTSSPVCAGGCGFGCSGTAAVEAARSSGRLVEGIEEARHAHPRRQRVAAETERGLHRETGWATGRRAVAEAAGEGRLLGVVRGQHEGAAKESGEAHLGGSHVAGVRDADGGFLRIKVPPLPLGVRRSGAGAGAGAGAGRRELQPAGPVHVARVPGVLRGDRGHRGQRAELDLSARALGIGQSRQNLAHGGPRERARLGTLRRISNALLRRGRVGVHGACLSERSGVAQVLRGAPVRHLGDHSERLGLGLGLRQRRLRRRLPLRSAGEARAAPNVQKRGGDELLLRSARPRERAHPVVRSEALLRGLRRTRHYVVFILHKLFRFAPIPISKAQSAWGGRPLHARP